MVAQQQHGRFRFRTEWLPLPGQTYLHFPGVRPDRGACPGCGAAENLYCAPGCKLSDPYAHDTIGRLRRCLLCSLADNRWPSASGVVMFLPHRQTRHLVKEGTEESLCRVTSVERGALVIPLDSW